MVLMPIRGSAMIYHASKQVGESGKWLESLNRNLINKVGKSKPMPRKEKNVIKKRMYFHKLIYFNFSYSLFFPALPTLARNVPAQLQNFRAPPAEGNR